MIDFVNRLGVRMPRRRKLLIFLALEGQVPAPIHTGSVRPPYPSAAGESDTPVPETRASSPGPRPEHGASLARRLPPPFSDPMIEKLWTVAEIHSSRTDKPDSIFTGFCRWADQMDQ